MAPHSSILARKIPWAEELCSDALYTFNFSGRITLSLCFPKPHGQDIQSKGKRREKKLWWFYENNTLELQNWSHHILVLKEKLY